MLATLQTDNEQHTTCQSLHAAAAAFASHLEQTAAPAVDSFLAPEGQSPEATGVAADGADLAERDGGRSLEGR